MATALPTTAYCAIGPDRRIDIDLVRRNQASCGSAAGNVQGMAWPHLAGKGWRIVSVRIVEVGSADDVPEVDPAPAPKRKPPAPPSAKASAGSPTKISSPAMLRCHERMR